MQFPRLVYKSASVHELADDEADFNAAIKSGWFASVPEAIAGKSDVIIDNNGPSREELEHKAAELGIEYDGRIGDKKLLALIAAKLESE